MGLYDKSLTDLDLSSLRSLLSDPSHALEFLRDAGIVGSDGGSTAPYGGTDCVIPEELYKEDTPLRTLWYSVEMSSRYPIQVHERLDYSDPDVGKFILLHNCAGDYWNTRNRSTNPDHWPKMFYLYEDEVSEPITSRQVNLKVSPRFY